LRAQTQPQQRPPLADPSPHPVRLPPQERIALFLIDVHRPAEDQGGVAFGERRRRVAAEAVNEAQLMSKVPEGLAGHRRVFDRIILKHQDPHRIASFTQRMEPVAEPGGRRERGRLAPGI